MTDKKIIPLFTAQDWHQRFDELNYKPTMLLGHMRAIRITMNIITQKVEAAQSLDELKTELLTLIKQQQEFLKDVEEKWSSDNPEQYGLPELSVK